MQRLLTAILFLLLFVAPLSAAELAPLVLFEEGHGQAFRSGAEGELDLSLFAGQLRAAGCRVATVDRLDRAALATAAALVISGPFQPFTAAEREEILAFVARGGRLTVMLHIGPPVADLLAPLGIYHSNGVVRESKAVLNNHPLDFQVEDLAVHPIFRGLHGFALFGGWALQAEGDAGVIARTGPAAWIDLNGDGQRSAGDATGAFGVVAAGKHGNGQFVVFGDDAVFQNRYLRQYNGELGDRLAHWLKGDI